MLHRDCAEGQVQLQWLRRQGLQLLVRQVPGHRRLAVGALQAISSYSVVVSTLMSGF